MRTRPANRKDAFVVYQHEVGAHSRENRIDCALHLAAALRVRSIWCHVVTRSQDPSLSESSMRGGSHRGPESASETYAFMSASPEAKLAVWAILAEAARVDCATGPVCLPSFRCAPLPT